MEYISRKFWLSSARPILLTTRPLMGKAEMPAAPIMGFSHNMLKITSDSRKISLGQRLMNSALPDDPNSKLRAYPQINKSDTLALLMKKLFDQNRIEDAKRASENKEYRAQLMKELGIN